MCHATKTTQGGIASTIGHNQTTDRVAALSRLWCQFLFVHLLYFLHQAAPYVQPPPATTSHTTHNTADDSTAMRCNNQGRLTCANNTGWSVQEWPKPWPWLPFGFGYQRSHVSTTTPPHRRLLLQFGQAASVSHHRTRVHTCSRCITRARRNTAARVLKI